jgi:hypothetical protein
MAPISGSPANSAAALYRNRPIGDARTMGRSSSSECVCPTSAADENGCLAESFDKGMAVEFCLRLTMASFSGR